MARAIGLASRLLVICVISVAAGWAGEPKPTAKRIAVFFQDARASARVKAFQGALREMGYVPGETVQYDEHIAAADGDDLDLVARNLVGTRPDLIFAVGTPPALAARRATSTTPILFYVSDPVRTGLAQSLAHPGGNATGIASLADELSAKRLELLKEVVPRARRIAVLANVDNPATKYQLESLAVAAKVLHLKLTVLNADSIEALDKVLAKLTSSQFDGALLVGDIIINTHQKRIAERALTQRLPTISPFDGYTRTGGLMSYGPNLTEVLARCAAYADRLLKGTRPADLPVEQMSRYKLLVNVTTAKRLGLKLPESINIMMDEPVH